MKIIPRNQKQNQAKEPNHVSITKNELFQETLQLSNLIGYSHGQKDPQKAFKYVFSNHIVNLIPYCHFETIGQAGRKEPELTRAKRAENQQPQQFRR